MSARVQIVWEALKIKGLRAIGDSANKSANKGIVQVTRKRIKKRKKILDLYR